ncbi:MAG TPA: fimbrial assembly protein [Verrucomicrobiae bacterium]|jgi:type IV pilus assembly protein PilN|nr:fimbrial assembly protein [Verrucomicrobiae bacterium]
MKITINLASQPYVDVRQVLKQLRILMGILVLLAIPLWLLLRGEQHKAQDATARVDTVEKHVTKLEQQQQSYQVLMRQPQNAAVLTQSDFLNSLFRRKAFSWTATMTDLETVLPAGVQVLSIDPEVAKDGGVTIRLRVSGARDKAVDLVRNLEKSRHFGSPRLAGEALASATANGPNAALQPINAAIDVNFDILADYRPLSEAEEQASKAESAAEKKLDETTAGEKKSVSPKAHTAAPKKRGAQ